MNRTVQAGLVVAALLVFIMVVLTSKHTDQQQRLTVYSRNSSGLTAFAEFSAAVHGQPPVIRKKALLDRDDLPKDGVFIAVSPVLPYSERESGILKEYLRDGGRVLTSFHNTESEQIVLDLLRAIGLTIDVADNDRYFDGIPTRLAPPVENELFAAGNTYSFYSRRYFEKCVDEAFKCFVRTFAVGEGSLTVIAGLPPIANALIGEDGNKNFATALLTRFKNVTVDEYRHLLHERTLTDLLLEPTFFIPIGGLIASIIVFFFFGRLSLHDRLEQDETVVAPRPYHWLNEAIIASLVPRGASKSGINNQHVELLIRSLPESAAEISATWKKAVREHPDDVLAIGSILIKQHREILQRKGRII